MPGQLLQALLTTEGGRVGGLPKAYLQRVQAKAREKFPQAVMIIDNSGSTESKADGTLYTCPDHADASYQLTTKQRRIREICQRARDSLDIYRFLGIECRIAVLNNWDGQNAIDASVNYDGSPDSYEACRQYIDKIEGFVTGPTPLSRTIEQTAHPLLAAGDDAKGMILNIVTDGSPYEPKVNAHGLLVDAYNRLVDARNAVNLDSFDRVANTLREIVRRLTSVNVVVNITTNDDKLIEQYNDLDKACGIEDKDGSGLDVIDDIAGETQEVLKGNPALSYPLMLHLLRTSGVMAHQKAFNDIDDEEGLSDEALVEFAIEVMSLDPRKLNSDHFEDILSRVPFVKKPTIRTDRNGDSYIDGFTFQPLIDHTRLASALIGTQGSGFFAGMYKLWLYFRLHVVGSFVPDEKALAAAKSNAKFTGTNIQLNVCVTKTQEQQAMAQRQAQMMPSAQPVFSGTAPMPTPMYQATASAVASAPYVQPQVQSGCTPGQLPVAEPVTGQQVSMSGAGFAPPPPGLQPQMPDNRAGYQGGGPRF